MITTDTVSKVFDDATREFFESTEYRNLVSGEATAEAAREFLCNVFRTHYLSSHIVALCFAALPSAAAELLKENLLEEMGRSEHEQPHSALLLEIARGIGLIEQEIQTLIAGARWRFSAPRACRWRPCASFVYRCCSKPRASNACSRAVRAGSPKP
jgi:hypothetical protein